MTSNGKSDLKKIMEHHDDYAPTENLLKNQCPRCLGPIPNLKYAGEYPGAVSRTDNETEICSNCGTAEALEQTFPRVSRHGRDRIVPQSEWLVNRVR